MPRTLMWVIRLSMVAAIAVLAPLATAGTTGKLTGRVMNEKKEPLTGVNVRFEGLRLGAITDDQGNYSVLGVPGGVYTVRMNLLGYAAYVATNVTITPDFTTSLDATMQSEAVQMQEVRVDATRPLLQKDATGTTRFLSGDDIQKLPTRGYRDAAAQQTGIVNFARNIDNEAQNGNTLIIRGGRPNETAYYVDGFSQQDPLTGTTSTTISNNSIEEVVVLTGGFNAEYGRIMSGAINVITREGASKYSGSVEAVSDVLAGDWISADKTDYNIYDVALGGPVFPKYENLTFYASGERRWQRDRSPSFLTDDFRNELASQGLSDKFKPNNQSGGFTFQGKLGWQLNNNMTLKLGGVGSEEQWRQYSHAYLLNLDHSPRYLDRNQSYFGTFNHSLSAKSYYTLGANFFRTLRKRGDGVAFDRLEEYYVPTNPSYDQDVPVFFAQGHVFDDYLQRDSKYVGGQGAFTSQLNRYHQLKVGADYQRHTLRYFDHFFPVQLGGPTPNDRDWDGYGYDLVQVGNRWELQENDRDSNKDGPKHPVTYSTFVQDKFEREGVIVNGGLRYDYINVETPALISERFPLGNPDSPDPNSLPDSLQSSDLTTNKTYSRISPRLGVAFPVDEQTILRFNYGQFYQQPNLQDLYASYRFLQYKIRTGGYFVGFGNPNLKPEQTTAYEVGLQRQLGDQIRVDATAYYKDVKDLVEIENIPSFPNSFSSYRNRDFATIKGVDIGFTMRKTNHIATSLSYSAVVRARGRARSRRRSAISRGPRASPPSRPRRSTSTSATSCRSTWTRSLGKGEGPLWNGHRWFEDTGLNLLFNVASGTPYTPTKVYNEVTLAAVALEPSGPINSRYGPWTSNLDLKATRGFQVGSNRFEIYAWALNVFDSHNPITVYTSTGSPTATGWLTTEDGQAFVANTSAKNGLATYELAENNPNFYSNPRLVRFGVRASF